MMIANPLFDYTTKKIRDTTRFEWTLLRAIQLGAKLSARWGYRGFGACCRVIQALIPARTLTIMLNNDTAFTFPFADGYWSMLLGGADVYEPEIEDFFKSIANENYTLVDCGANYGYWSVLASGSRFGSQRVIAIEPSAKTFSVLRKNAALNGNRFSCIKTAVGSFSGTAHLSGRKHEARAISSITSKDGESVGIIALDSMMDDGHIAFGEKIVVKLDVEGLEIAALAGSSRLLEGDCVVICEDHGSDRNHTVSRYILEKTPLSLFYYSVETGRFVNITEVTSLDRIKHFRNRGYNVFATASPYWKEKLGSISRPAEGDKSRRVRKMTIGSLARGYFISLL